MSHLNPGSFSLSRRSCNLVKWQVWKNGGSSGVLIQIAPHLLLEKEYGSSSWAVVSLSSGRGGLVIWGNL